MSPPGPARRWRHIRGGWKLGHPAAIAANDVFLRLLIAASPRLAVRVMNRQFQKDAAAIREMADDLAEAGYGGTA